MGPPWMLGTCPREKSAGKEKKWRPGRSQPKRVRAVLPGTGHRDTFPCCVCAGQERRCSRLCKTISLLDMLFSSLPLLYSFLFVLFSFALGSSPLRWFLTKACSNLFNAFKTAYEIEAKRSFGRGQLRSKNRGLRSEGTLWRSI